MAWPPRRGVGAEVCEDLVDHRGLRDARDDPRGALTNPFEVCSINASAVNKNAREFLLDSLSLYLPCSASRASAWTWPVAADLTAYAQPRHESHPSMESRMTSFRDNPLSILRPRSGFAERNRYLPGIGGLLAALFVLDTDTARADEGGYRRLHDWKSREPAWRDPAGARSGRPSNHGTWR